MSSDTREITIKQARDAGANMVLAKPMSPASLYDRLAWVAFNPRSSSMRRLISGPTAASRSRAIRGGVGRRKGDHEIAVADEARPACRKTISTICSTPHGWGRNDVRHDRPSGPRFPGRDPLPEAGAAAGGVSREKAIESAQARIEENKPGFEDWLNTELASLIDGSLALRPARPGRIGSTPPTRTAARCATLAPRWASRC